MCQTSLSPIASHQNNSHLVKKLATRFFVVQAIFQMEISGQNSSTIIKEFKTHRFGEKFDNYQMHDGDKNLFSNIIKMILRHQSKIDQTTDKILSDNWPFERIDPTLRAIFRASSGEALLAKTPPNVIISQYVDITRAFYPNGKEISFANAVIDKIIQALLVIQTQ